MPYFCLIRASYNKSVHGTWSLRNICRMHNYPGKLILKYRGERPGLGLLSPHQWVGVRAGNSFMPTSDAGVCIQIDRKPAHISYISNIAQCVNLIRNSQATSSQSSRVAQNMVLIYKCHPPHHHLASLPVGQCLNILASHLRQSILQRMTGDISWECVGIWSKQTQYKKRTALIVLWDCVTFYFMFLAESPFQMFRMFW